MQNGNFNEKIKISSPFHDLDLQLGNQYKTFDDKSSILIKGDNKFKKNHFL